MKNTCEEAFCYCSTSCSPGATFCPIKQSISVQQAKQAELKDPEHNLTNKCIIGQSLVGSDSYYRSNGSVIETHKCLFNNITENKENVQTKPDQELESALTLEQINAVKEVMRSFLNPASDPTNRCSSCAKCISCSPTELLNIELGRN